MSIYNSPTETFNKLEYHSTKLSECAHLILKGVGDRDELEQRMREHFEQLETYMFHLECEDGEDLIVPENPTGSVAETLTMADVDRAMSIPPRSTRTVEDWDETPEVNKDEFYGYSGGQSDE